jgi:hypothetical protein
MLQIGGAFNTKNPPLVLVRASTGDGRLTPTISCSVTAAGTRGARHAGPAHTATLGLPGVGGKRVNRGAVNRGDGADVSQ